MCWHHPRRTINPAYRSSADYSPSTQRLYFNCCVKASGFCHQESDKTICRTCYIHLPSQYTRSTYQYFFVHNLLYCIEIPPLNCHICKRILSAFRTVLHCTECYDTHELFSTIIAEQGRTIEDYGDPLLIPIVTTIE